MNASADISVQQVKLLIKGEWVESKTTHWQDIVNPATQQVLAKVPFATSDEVNLTCCTEISAEAFMWSPNLIFVQRTKALNRLEE